MTEREQGQQMWEEIWRIFDPLQPVTDSRLRAPRDPAYDRVRLLAAELARPYAQGERKSVLAGPIGSGKTTELRALAEELSSRRVVIFVDLWVHFQGTVRDPKAIDRLQPWELVGLLGLAVYRAAEERFGHRWGTEPRALEQALQRLRGQGSEASAGRIDLAKLAKGLAVVAGGAVGGPAGAAGGVLALQVLQAAADSATWDWKIGLPHRARRSDQDGEVRAVLDATNQLILALQGEYGQRLLIVADGLDRVETDATFTELFVDSSLLSELVSDLVVSGSARVGARQGAALRGFERHLLTYPPVLDHEDPSRPGPGVAFFRDLVARRLDSLDLGAARPLPVEQVDRLAWASGGVAREFIRLIRSLVDEVWPDGPAQASEAAVEAVIDRARRAKEEGMTREDVELLERVAIQPEHLLPNLEQAHELVKLHCLLPYPNRSTWYYPHPLLTLALVRTRPGSRPSAES